MQDDGWSPISLEPKRSEQFWNMICVQNGVYFHIWTGFDKEMLKKRPNGKGSPHRVVSYSVEFALGNVVFEVVKMKT